MVMHVPGYHMVANPRWRTLRDVTGSPLLDRDGAPRRVIDCEVLFDHLLVLNIRDAVPFSASPTDPEPHGREIFARAAAGEFGEVAAEANG